MFGFRVNTHCCTRSARICRPDRSVSLLLPPRFIVAAFRSARSLDGPRVCRRSGYLPTYLPPGYGGGVPVTFAHVKRTAFSREIQRNARAVQKKRIFPTIIYYAIYALKMARSSGEEQSERYRYYIACTLALCDTVDFECGSSLRMIDYTRTGAKRNPPHFPEHVSFYDVANDRNPASFIRPNVRRNV